MGDPDIAERLAYRLEVWKRFTEVFDSRCRRCLDSRRHVAIKATPAGSLCIACWLTYEPCAHCGIEAGLYEHAGGRCCALCLNPEPTDAEVAEMLLTAAGGRDGGDGVMHMPYWIDY